MDPVEIALSALRMSTPLLFAALGGYFSEKSGVINISLEGKLLIGAFAAGVIAYLTGSEWWGFFGGGVAGMILAVIYGFFVLGLAANQIIAGTAINLLAFGIPPLISKVLFDTTGNTPALADEARFFIAPTLIALAIALGVWLWVRLSRGGLWLTFAGEEPKALASVGISPLLVRWNAVVICGLLAGLGGASLALQLASGYSRGMSAGRGFMALAALILGRWRPLPAAFACLFFGFVDALQIRLQSFGNLPIPSQFVQMLPYLLTLIALTGMVGRASAPRALGRAVDA
jgi:general nucleoside transport system permease protein